MATMNVSLPDKMKEWVEAQARTGRYGNASDYVRDLIRKDQEDETYRRYLQQAINEGLKSEVVDYSRDELVRDMRRSSG